MASKLCVQNDEDGEINWAKVAYENSEVMFSAGGLASTANRREVDLYITINNVDDLHCQLKNRADVVQYPSETFYGMREFIIRDLNGFWITFGQLGTQMTR